MSAPNAPEKRVQRHATLAFVAAAVLAVVVALTGNGRLLGLEVSPAAAAGLALAGLAAGIVAALRRLTWLALLAALLLVLAVTPGGDVQPRLVDYALGFAFAGALLVAVELVHMTVRYERAHRAVERDNVPVEHVNRVTNEALKTLAERAGLALAAVFGMLGVAYLLSLVGPAAWRDAIETTAPLGVAFVALVLLGIAGLVILIRGAVFRRSDDSTIPTETASDAVE